MSKKTIGKDIIKGLEDALAYIKGDKTRGTSYVVDSKTGEVTECTLEEFFNENTK